MINYFFSLCFGPLTPSDKAFVSPFTTTAMVTACLSFALGVAALVINEPSGVWNLLRSLIGLNLVEFVGLVTVLVCFLAFNLDPANRVQSFLRGFAFVTGKLTAGLLGAVSGFCVGLAIPMAFALDVQHGFLMVVLSLLVVIYQLIFLGIFKIAFDTDWCEYQRLRESPRKSLAYFSLIGIGFMLWLIASILK